MADQNIYLKYKRDQRHLVYWITHTSAQIVKQHPESPVVANTTGVISLATLKSLSGLIAKHLDRVPTTIFRLFESIIDARKATHNLFLKITASNPDPDIQKSNESHKYWIDGLTEAFNTLGGETWQSGKRSESDAPDEDEDQLIFTNTFSTLSLDNHTKEGCQDGDGDDGDDEDADITEQATATATGRSKQKSTKKRKKHGRGRKPKTKGKTVDTASSADLQEVPLESYRIIEDELGMMTDYLMAVYSLTRQLIELRHYLQGVWRQVAYQGLNSVVAANLCNVAIGMIKDTQSQIFVDFPGHDSFDIIMQTLTRGDPDRAQGMFYMQAGQYKPDGTCDMSRQYDIDVREEFLLHSYQDLFDFVTDYQKTRSGKPTKGMLKSIQNWDPKLDLQRATKEQRLKWRRAYTINWLYDLVNIFSSIVIQRRTLRGQTIPLETVDWSRTGPWNQHRRLFGINEFAGDITHLAVQKPGTDVRSKILPHHVFQLQCIMDSLAVSRGWSIGTVVGHVLSPPASNFRPRRDVDLFLDRETERSTKGFCNSVEVLVQLFDRDAMLHGDPNRNASLKEMLLELRLDFINWLGESKYMYGLTDIPPSRFSNTNSNGLWEYCPFLCGAGLSEALELAYGMGLLIWDNVPEPMCILHLHNMLVQKGLIARPVGLWDTLEFLFQDSFFLNGKIPTSNFVEALEAVVGGPNSRREAFQNRAGRRQLARNATDTNDLLDAGVNRFFRTKSLLRIYRIADWIPDRIPDEEIPFPSGLAFLRLAEAKQTRDRATGMVTLVDTKLVRRARFRGMSDKDIIRISSKLSSMSKEPDMSEMLESLQATLSEGHSCGKPPGGLGKHDLSLSAYLNILKHDFIGDICGQMRPLSSLNYMWVLVRCYVLFMQIEEKLRACRNPTWVRAYEGNSRLTQQKRLSLTVLALRQEDQECLRIMAHVFETQRGGFIEHIYWDDLLDSVTAEETRVSEDDTPFNPDSCTLM